MVLIGVAGCASTPEEPTPRMVESSSVTEIDPIKDFLETLPPDTDPRARSAAAALIGAPVDRLEKLTGPATLVRVEGENEFRRYDLGNCRAYAVIIPAGGNVVSIATGPAVAGNQAPSFDVCLEARRHAGT